MAINFASDGGSGGKALTLAQRQRLIEEKELINDRLDALGRAIQQVEVVIKAVEDVDYYRRAAVLEGYTV